MVARAGQIAVLVLFVVSFSPSPGHAQSTLVVIDNEPFGAGGPADSVFSIRRNAQYVITVAFNIGQAATFRRERDGTLTPVGQSWVGPEPRAIAMARNGDYAVVVNSSSNEVASFAVGDDGLLTEVDRVSSGGANPYDTAVGYNDIVVVANRDSDQINTFHIDRRGRLIPLEQAAAGIGPHVVSVSHSGLVGVANQTDQSVSMYDLNRRGQLVPLGPPIAMSDHGSNPPASMTPRTVTVRDHTLYAALDAPGTNEDVIRSFHVARNGQIQELGDTPGGAFLTDLEANEDGLFAVTANRNNAADPTAARNEVRFYRSEGTDLILEAAVQTPGFPPSFKQIAGRRGRGGLFWLAVTEYQSGWLRWLVFDPAEEP